MERDETVGNDSKMYKTCVNARERSWEPVKY